VQLHDTPLGPSRGHGGWFPGYLTEVEYFPEHRFAVVVQINTDVGGPVKRKQREFAARVAEKVRAAL
jgi:D-alanyl-D-alanine carboxypeptidase